MNYKNKGITLVALVVTIIVLLILATVSINLTIGQNGLFQRARNAVNTYNQSRENEDQDLHNTENTMQNLIDLYDGK